MASGRKAQAWLAHSKAFGSPCGTFSGYTVAFPAWSIDVDPSTALPLVEGLRSLQERIQRTVIEQLRARDAEAMAQVAKDTGGDIIYSIDADIEEVLLEFCDDWSGRLAQVGNLRHFVLIAEGLGEEDRRAFPEGLDPADADFFVIIDPIDGTRPLMYDKRSAWSLAAIVPNSGGAPRLRDAVAACMTELPTSKQGCADCLYAVRGRRPTLERRNLITGEAVERPYSPSRADHIEHGFAMLVNFFPGGKEVVSAIEEELVRELRAVRRGRSVVFSDQYLSTGGQFYELIVGHDRFNGDLRGRMIERQLPRGAVPALAAHPYDCCAELLAREAGVIITDIDGRPFDAPLDTESPVSWLGYANEALRRTIEPVLQRLLRKHGLID